MPALRSAATTGNSPYRAPEGPRLGPQTAAAALFRLRDLVFRAFLAAFRVTSRAQLGRRFPPLRRAYFALRDVLSPARYEVDGLWLRVHRDDRALTHALTTAGVFEPVVSAALEVALREGDLFLDVGANIGYHTALAARRVGPAGRVLAVEPEPRNLELLRVNIATNGLGNVEVLAAAAGRTAGSLELYTSESNRGDHRSYAVEGRPHVRVPVLRLDDELRSTPNVVKIDVQGYEPEVISGLSETLRRGAECVLVTEVWSKGLERVGSDTATYIAQLRGLGFELFELPDDGGVRALPADWSLTPRDTNVLAVKGARGHAAKERLVELLRPSSA